MHSHLQSRAFLFLLLLLSPSLGLAAQEDLFVAARQGDAAKVRQLLADGADANARDDMGRTPLHIAAEKDVAEVVEALLQGGAVPILTDWRGLSPLSVAVSKKHDRVAALLRKAIGPLGDSPAACEIDRLRSDDAKGEQRRFLAGHSTRVREAMLDALQAIGFVPKEKSVPANLAELKHLEVRRLNTKIVGTGGGAGGERAVVDFEDADENGRWGVAVSVDTKKGFAGRARQHNWSVPLLDEAACLLALLGNEPLDIAPTTPLASGGVTVGLADGASVKLHLFRFVNSQQVQDGTKLPLIVMEDIVKDGKVLVRRGSPGWGSITGLEKAASYGREARFRFQVDSVRAVDNQDIRLRNSAQGAGKRSAGRTAITAASMPLLGLLMKGEERGIRAGIVLVGYVDGERQVRVVTP